MYTVGHDEKPFAQTPEGWAYYHERARQRHAAGKCNGKPGCFFCSSEWPGGQEPVLTFTHCDGAQLVVHLKGTDCSIECPHDFATECGYGKKKVVWSHWHGDGHCGMECVVEGAAMGKSPEEKINAIREIVNDSNPELIEALKELACWVPGDGHYPLNAVSEIVNGGPGYYDGDEDSTIRDEECPLFTETFAYNLFGKEDGRTFLALLHNVLEAAGLDRWAESKWVSDVVHKTIERKQTEAERQKRRAEKKAK